MPLDQSLSEFAAFHFSIEVVPASLRARGNRHNKNNCGKHGAAKTKRRSNHQSPRRRKIYRNNFLALRRVLVFKLPRE